MRNTWIAFSHRPLTLPEICVALSTEDDDSDLDPAKLFTDPQNVMSLSGGLVVHGTVSNGVSFVHHTIHGLLIELDFCPQIFYIDEEGSHMQPASTCLRYLQFHAVVEANDDQPQTWSSLARPVVRL
jgi:hypothetical protein